MGASRTGEPASLKDRVRAHWEAEPCGTREGSSPSRREYFDEIAAARYRLDPFILEEAGFAAGEGRKVLEIGVGAGSDFEQWVRHGALATGVDLTTAGIELARERLELAGVEPGRYTLRTADAENLPFADGSFDIVYSWGVLHHSPNTEKALSEAHRVLCPGGRLIAMVYHRPSWVGWMLWVRHALARGRPLRSPRRVIFEHLESPGTKAYTVDEARRMLEGIGFEKIEVRSRLCSGDLLTIKPSFRYGGTAYRLLWKLYPRWLVRLLGDRFGLALILRAERPRAVGQ